MLYWLLQGWGINHYNPARERPMWTSQKTPKSEIKAFKVVGARNNEKEQEFFAPSAKTAHQLGVSLLNKKDFETASIYENVGGMTFVFLVQYSK